MGGTVYAINVVTVKGYSGFVKFEGNGTWDWHLVQDVDQATLYRSREECLKDFYEHIQNAFSEKNGDRVDRSKCRISECYNPWL